MQWSALSNPTFFHKSTFVRPDKLIDKNLLCGSIHLGIALGDHVQRERAIPILDRSSLGSHFQNLSDDSCACLGIAFGCYCLVENRSTDVVVHDHGSYRNQGVASNTMQDWIPLILATHGEYRVHFITIRVAGRLRFCTVHCHEGGGQAEVKGMKESGFNRQRWEKKSIVWQCLIVSSEIDNSLRCCIREVRSNLLASRIVMCMFHDGFFVPDPTPK